MVTSATVRWTLSICCVIACTSSSNGPPPERVLQHVPVLDRAVRAALATVPPLVVIRESGPRTILEAPQHWNALASFDLRRAKPAAVPVVDAPKPVPTLPAPASEVVVVPAREDMPRRVVSLVAVPAGSAPPALLLAAPYAKATAMVDALASTNAAIAVRQGDEIRPLALEFRAAGALPDDAWAEIRIGPSSAELEAVPGVPVKISHDPVKIVAAYRDLAALHAYKPAAPVDLLVAPDVDVITTLQIVAALHEAGVQTIGLGVLPDDQQRQRRGRTIARLTFRSTGELDAAAVQVAIASERRRLWACYAAELSGALELAGTVTLAYRVARDGKPGNMAATGVPSVAPCLETVMGTLTLPAGAATGSKMTTVFELHPNLW
jgi:hypothetical protein